MRTRSKRRTAAVERTSHLACDVQSLETRRLLAATFYQPPINASPSEQLMVELVNRMRMDPQGEYARLVNAESPELNGPDANVKFAMQYFNVDLNVLKQQWQSLAPVQPLAWSDTLAAGADGNTQKMIVNGQTVIAKKQNNDPNPGEVKYGHFTGDNVWENAGGGDNIFYSHAGLAVDWGNGPGGIQSPPGHRDNIMNAAQELIGVGAVQGQVIEYHGPWWVTQRFDSSTNPLLTGVAFRDKDSDGFYDVGEQLDRVTITAVNAVTGDRYYTHAGPSGGYRLELPPGGYTMYYSGFEPDNDGGGSYFASGGIEGVPSQIMADRNVKYDIMFPPQGKLKRNVPAPNVPQITGPGTTTADTTPTISWNAPAYGTQYELLVYNNGVQIGADGKSVAPGTAPIMAGGTSFTPQTPWAASAPGTIYTVHVRAWNSVGMPGNYSAAYNFQIAAGGSPATPSPFAPDGFGSQEFSWRSVPNAARYEVLMYNATPGEQAQLVPVTSVDGTSFQPRETLAAGKMYQLFVRAVSASGLRSDWGKLQFENPVETRVPDAPRIAVADITSRPAVTWTAVDQTDHYELLAYNTETGRQVASETRLTATSYRAASDWQAGEHQVFVRAVNARGQSGQWGKQEFRVESALPRPILSGPASVTYDPRPLISWTGNRGDVFEVVAYDVRAGRQVLHQSDLTTTSYRPPRELTPGTEYAFYVRRLDGRRAGVWSDPLKFEVQSATELHFLPFNEQLLATDRFGLAEIRSLDEVFRDLGRQSLNRSPTR